MFKRMHRFDYTPADCEAFHKATEAVCVPVLRRLNDERRAALDVDALRPWDLAVDIKGRPPLRPFDGADELVDKTSRLFHTMEPGLCRRFALRQALGEGLRPDRRAGGAA